MKFVRRLLYVVVALIALLALGVYLFLRGSLAQLDGQARIGVSAPVTVTRDATGYVTVTAANRLDVARALGFVHAQERFFQMDLLRRNAAGELSALVGAKAVPLDTRLRLNRFRWRAEQALKALPQDQQQLLEAYAAGVNAGLAGLSARPFEYGLLRQQPAPWRPADSMLAVLSMYLDLQGAQGRDELAMGVLKDGVPADWYAFLTQHSVDWSAAVDGSVPDALPVPGAAWPFAGAKQASCSDCGLPDGRIIGSNNFAVGGALTADGDAIVANDMHLSITVPGIWFKAQLRWTDETGVKRMVAGVTLPGVPAVVAGSNGHVAWGFTNSTAQWTDVVALKLDADASHYLTPQGEQPVVVHKERIDVAGGAPVDIEVRETEWGPIMAKPFDHYALRWVAHDVAGLNLRLQGMERANTIDDALATAVGAGIPAQNLMVGDSTGRIAWAIIGAIPRRHYAPGADMNVPQDWSTGATGWDGWLGRGDAWPRVVNPADARLWSANNRLVGGANLALLGTGGYDLGARGQQIRDDLRAKAKFAEPDLYAIQLDDRAVLLARWKQLLLERVLTPDFVAKNGLADYRKAVATSADAATADAVGYTYVHEFRARVLEQLFKPVAALMEAHGLKATDLKWSPETPGWAMLQSGRADLLPGGQTLDAFLAQAVLDSRAALLARVHGDTAKLAWGEQNFCDCRHPLSRAVPALSSWLDLPRTPMNGDGNMPRVHRGVHGQSERFVVAPGHEDRGILVIPAGQSGHPLSPYFRADHRYWLNAEQLPFLPQPSEHALTLQP